MTELEKMESWLQTFPLWEGELAVDRTEAKPVSAGLYPLGLEELGRTRDVLGNVSLHCRCRFLLRRRAAEADRENACWLLALQNWIQEQSARGAAPVFGDEPGRERIRAEKGSLADPKQTATALYTVTVSVDFVRNITI